MHPHLAPPPASPERFLDQLGEPSDPCPHRPPADDRFRIIPLASRRGWPIAICEAAPRRSLPRYRERRLWRNTVSEPLRSGILLFTDAAHSCFVWSWQGRSRSVERYVEHLIPGREATLAVELERLPPGTDRIASPGPEPSPTCRGLFRSFARLGLRYAPETGPGLQALQSWIEEIGSPSLLRVVWRTLRAFAVLDPSCRRGAALVKAGSELEPVYLATLERMRALVDEEVGGRTGRRPEHLRDLRDIIELAEHARWGHDRARFVRRTVVRQNLFGIATSRSAARRVVRDLLAFADLGQDGLPILDCNVREAPDLRSAPRPPKRSRDATIILTDGQRVYEEVEIFRSAWATVRHMRSSAAPDAGEFALAAAQLERRRLHLRQQLLLIAAGDALDAGPRQRSLDSLGFSDARERSAFPVVLA